MKGVVFLGDGQLEIRNVSDPIPGPDEVVVDIKASGLCGSDLYLYRPPRKGSDSIKLAGHEPCGVVADIGSQVTVVEVGDRVMVHHYSGCGLCTMCRIGYTQMCLDHHEVYGKSKDGSHADFMLVPASTCVPLPDNLSFAIGAACACGTGTAFHAIQRLKVSDLNTVAVFGQGPVGLSATMFAALMGARVIAIDVINERLELAIKMGANIVINATEGSPVTAINEYTDGIGADMVLEATGIPNVRNNAIDSVKNWGKLCFVGEGGETSFDVSRQIIHRQLTLFGSWTFSIEGLAEVARFVDEKNAPVNDLITHRFPIEQASEAYQLFGSGKTGKVVFED